MPKQEINGILLVVKYILGEIIMCANSVWIFLKKVMFSYYAILPSFEPISSIVCKIAFVVYWVRIMVLNATFNNISVISWPFFVFFWYTCVLKVLHVETCVFIWILLLISIDSEAYSRPTLIRTTRKIRHRSIT